MATFGDRLRKSRISLDLTLEDLAEKIGTTKSTISRYENDLRVPNGNFIKDAAHNLNVTTDYLLGNDDIDTRDIYNIDADIAAHLDGKDFTDDHKQQILNFIDFIDSKE